jgi:hypothetical protein
MTVLGIGRAVAVGLFVLFLLSIGIARDTCALPNGRTIEVWTGNDTFLGLGGSPHSECKRDTLLEVLLP